MRRITKGMLVKALFALALVLIYEVFYPWYAESHRASVMITERQIAHVTRCSTTQPYQLPTRGSQYDLSGAGTYRETEELTRSSPPHVHYVADSANEKTEIKSFQEKQEEACMLRWREGQCPCLPPSLMPCRDRESHLRAFLAHMHPVLQRQQLAYRILVIEQRLPTVFNKAATMNAGFAVAISHDWAFDCVVLHDVDLLMEDDRNLLTCGQKVMHYGMFIDKFDYKKIGGVLFGGIVAMTREQFVTINGYTNQFFGWGGEDDNAHTRVRGKNFAISRPSVSVGKYSSLRHPRDKANPKIRRPRSVLWNATYEEGLSTVSYDVVSILMQPTFTHVIIDLNTTSLPYPWINSRETATYFDKVPNTTCSNTDDVVGTLNNTGDNFLNHCMDLCSVNTRCSAITMEQAADRACRMRASHCIEERSKLPGTTLFLKAVDSDC